MQDRRHKQLRIRRLRVIQHTVGQALLDNMAVFHDHDAMGQKPGHGEIYQMYKDLLRLRREDAALSSSLCKPPPRPSPGVPGEGEEGVSRPVWRRGALDGAVLGNHVFALRYFGDGGDDRLIVVNFDGDLHLDRHHRRQP